MNSNKITHLFISVVVYMICGAAYTQSLEEAEKLNSLGLSLINQGRFKDAMPVLQHSLAVRESALGPMHFNTAISLNNLGEVYKRIGDYAKASSLLERSLEIRQKTLGFEHTETARGHNNLGSCYAWADEHMKAVTHYECAIKIWSKKNQENSDLAIAIKNLGYSYSRVGDYSKALPLLEQSVAIKEKTLGYEHESTAQSLITLADCLNAFKDYEKALPLAKRSLSIREKKLGLLHPDVASSLNTIATAYIGLGETAKALPLYERAISIWEKTLGPDHPDTATGLQNLAKVYSITGDYPKAINISERALSIREKSLGLDSAYTARSLSDLGFLYRCNGDKSKALPFMEKALRIMEKKFGAENANASLELINLTCLQYEMGNTLAAINYAKRFITSKESELNTVLALDEQSRLNWQRENIFYWPVLLLAPDLSAHFVLRFKGIVLDSLAEDHALALAIGSKGAGAQILNKIKSLQNRLSKIAFEQGKEEEGSKLQDEIARLQRELTSKYLGRERKRVSASMTMAEIMPALAGGGVLIDFIEFNDPKLKDDEATCLGAVITGEDNKPVFVRIDGGAAISRSIDALRAAINQGNASEVEAQTKFLSEKLWAPIAAKIPEGTKRLFLCPDANLNFLSFAALLESDGRFVAEKYPITYIGSARDLAKISSGKISKSMALVANPQFDAAAKNAKTTEIVAMRSAEADVFGSIALPPLPGTEVEAASLQSLAGENGWQTKSYLGKDATESIVRKTNKPGILHLATHGFYLNSFTPPGPEGSRGMSVVGVKETTEEKKKKEKGVDPMRASGVAFTGAQQTLTSWSQRKAPNPETDGVLTAEEVGALRLDGTWMVVLSACETGVGEARSGEGVFGLRRAFMIAGAENLLMTLWPVADETTAKIMADFYKEAFATGDAPGSLAKVQRDWLAKLRQERGLLAAIREAGPFAMVTMTNPNGKREFVEGQIEVTPEKAAMPKSDKILEFEVALAKADAGDAYAQAVVSIYYGLGVGCDQDPAKSKDYVMLSAKQQNPLGIYRLAEMREIGEGMDQNSEQALQLMKKAKPSLQKLSSDPYALTALATIYERENPESPKIREVLTKASEMGYEPAQEKLTQLPTNQ